MHADPAYERDTEGAGASHAVDERSVRTSPSISPPFGYLLMIFSHSAGVSANPQDRFGDTARRGAYPTGQTRSLTLGAPIRAPSVSERVFVSTKSRGQGTGAATARRYSFVGQLGKLRAGWQPARAAIANRRAGCHPAPQESHLSKRSRYQVPCPAQPDERYALSPVGNWRNRLTPSFALTCLRVVVYSLGSTESALMEAISVANADMHRCVHRNAVFAHLFRQHARHPHHRAFAGHVRDLPRVGQKYVARPP